MEVLTVCADCPEIGLATRLKRRWFIDIDAIIAAYQTETASEIARRLGCSTTTILRVLKKAIGSTDLRSVRPQLHPYSYQRDRK